MSERTCCCGERFQESDDCRAYDDEPQWDCQTIRWKLCADLREAREALDAAKQLESELRRRSELDSQQIEKWRKETGCLYPEDVRRLDESHLRLCQPHLVVASTEDGCVLCHHNREVDEARELVNGYARAVMERGDVGDTHEASPRDVHRIANARDEARERIAALTDELTEAKACLGYPAPGDFIPTRGLKCGICEAREKRIAELEARAKALHEALREIGVYRTEGVTGQRASFCDVCTRSWPSHSHEQHDIGCLAAPEQP